MDATAFERVARDHKNRVHGHAVWLLRDREEARDVAQEAFVRLWQNAERVPEDAARGWLLRTTHRLCLDRFRRLASRPEDAEDPEAPLDRIASDPGPDPERRALGRAVGDALAGALATLGPRDRAAVLLREVEGFTYEEIAATLDVPLGTLKAGLHRARARLRQRLVREGVRP